MRVQSFYEGVEFMYRLMKDLSGKGGKGGKDGKEGIRSGLSF